MTGPAQVPTPTVVVDRLSKWFGQKVAISDVSCSFGVGLTGLLGPNGAGKTTLLRVIAGLLRPSDGSVTVFGADPRRHPAVYRDVALIPEEDAVYGFLTLRQYVRYAAHLAGAPTANVDRAIRQVELDGDADRRVSEFSKGMRQRAKVAAALVTDPRLLILDEPLNGTDPVQRARLTRMFRELATDRTLIVSSHVLAEVERMADRVLAIVDGRLAAAGDVAAIRQAMTDIPYRVRIETEQPRSMAAALVASDAVLGVSLEGPTLHVETTDLGFLGSAVPAVAARLAARVTAFEPEDESLESVFRYLVRRR